MRKNNKGVRKTQAYRLRLYERDKGICHICNRAVDISNFTLDHILPKSKGGRATIDNLKIAHEKCNTKKGDKFSVSHKRLKLNLK